MRDIPGSGARIILAGRRGILMQSSGASSTRNCVNCGRSIAWDANVCPYCGHDYRAAMAGAPQQKKETVMPVLGGVFVLLASLAYILVGGVLTAGSTVLLGVSLGSTAVGVVCGIIVLVLGLVALLGAINAIQRKNFTLSLIGGIVVIPTLLGLIGFILIIVAKDEFSD